MTREKSDAEVAKELAADRYKIAEPTNAAVDELPQLNISANKPMICFVKGCVRRVIDNEEPWIIVSSQAGAIFAHMRCLGMNLSGNYNDPAYLRHIRDRLQTGLRDN